MWPRMNHLLSWWCRNSRLLVGLIIAAEYPCVAVTELYMKMLD